MNITGFDRPVFLTRVLQNEMKYVNQYPQFDGLIMDANLANYYSNPWNKILEKKAQGNVGFLIVDPNTAKLEHRVCVQKKTYALLSYCPDLEPLTPDDFQGESGDSFSLQFATNVLDTQAELGADIFLTPYFVAKTINSPWYGVNKELVQSSLTAKGDLGLENPLYAVICVSVSEIANDQSREIIIQDYRNLNVDGFYILAEGLSDRNSSSLELAGLLALVNSLSDFKKPVFVGSIDGFGLFSCAYGAAGFSAGICWLESFNEQNFTLELEGRNEDAMRERFIYIPEVFIKFPRDRAQLIYQNTNIEGLTSHQSSNYYNQRTINPDDRARLYFLEKRFEELEQLKGLSDFEKKQHLTTRLENAISISLQISSEDIQIRYAHLGRWNEAIRSV
ncbi:hypothetical protein [Paenibacillus terrae]|uniref:Uncharacterized protein n=1 Tax=Paenibacillus terrae TaxID=159743 RepID=A0A0D7WTM7_9BACL|nr:hypothetical protein [Paenibacillus terrae]KJD42531.1 hypothetical protein QD47_27650 [Paenibacillus terrae]